MDWFPFHVSDLAQERIAAASASAFGSWVRMLASCYKHENNGCYEHCSEYSDRQWMSIAGVSKQEVEEVVSARLAVWIGDSLDVEGYDTDQQDKATKRSDKGKLAAKARWSNARSNARSNAEERRGEEKKGEEIPARDPSATSTEHDLPEDHKRGDKWLVAFRGQWEPKHGRQYGRSTTADARAVSELSDLLASLPDEETKELYGRRKDMVSEFLSTADSRTVKAGLPFSWFVNQFRGLMIPKHMRSRPTQQSVGQVPALPLLGRLDE